MFLHFSAEPMGVVTAAVYLTIMFLFIPVPFIQWVNSEPDVLHEKVCVFLKLLCDVSVSL